MSDYVSYFLNSSSTVIQLETVEIAHPSFSQIYRKVKNATNGISAKLETGSWVDFEYLPMSISESAVRETLDFGVTITFGDLGEILPLELDRISNADTYLIRPTVVYRVYRSDDLTSPIYGPLSLEVASFAFKAEGAVFEATAPSLNSTGTGEAYRINRFPMLKGFI